MADAGPKQATGPWWTGFHPRDGSQLGQPSRALWGAVPGGRGLPQAAFWDQKPSGIRLAHQGSTAPQHLDSLPCWAPWGRG